jgi:hypothetical protein
LVSCFKVAQLFIIGPQNFEPTNYKNQWNRFSLQVLLFVQCKGKGKGKVKGKGEVKGKVKGKGKGKGKAIPVQTLRVN